MGIPLVDKHLQHLHSLCIDTEAALRLTKKHMQPDKEQCHKPYTFQVGDKVWLQAKQIKVHQQSVKLGPKQLGHFEITEVITEVNYRLALPPALWIHDVFHVDCLSPYKGNKINGLELPPPVPITVDGEEEYKVDYIRDSKVFGCTLKYLVHWKGYGEGEDTWEPKQNLMHAPAMLAEFHAQNSGALRTINALLYMFLPWQPLLQYTSANADVVP